MTTRLAEITWTDDVGRVARHHLRVDSSVDPDSSDLTAAVAALRALSSAATSAAALEVPHAFVDADPASPGEPSSTYCVLLFDTSGIYGASTSAFSFPGPAADCFDSDGFADPDSPTLDAVIAAIQDCATNPDGTAYGAFLGGHRCRIKELL